jgi:DNA-binding LacI/PurR family transcriptional regulator
LTGAEIKCYHYFTKTFHVSEENPMSITVKDVARVAGVSISTVSNVLNGKRSSYNAETHERVMQAVRQLDYHRNRMARSLVTKSSQVLGVCFGANTKALYQSAYVTEVLDGIMQAAEESDFNIMLYTRLPFNVDDRQMELILNKGIDGLCLIAPATRNTLPSQLHDIGFPLVLIGMEPLKDSMAWIDIDNAQGVTQALEHLYCLGHRRIAHISGSQIQRSGQQRHQAYLSFMESIGECVPADWNVSTEYNYESGLVAARLLLQSSEIPTAIVAANDHIALAVIDAASQRGIRIPDDLSLIGFDDIREAEYCRPRLTTVRQPMRQIGYNAGEWLIHSIKNEGTPLLRARVKPELIHRDSVAPPCTR